MYAAGRTENCPFGSSEKIKRLGSMEAAERVYKLAPDSFDGRISDARAGTDFSVFLTSTYSLPGKGSVYTVGKNVQGCLGLSIPDFTIQGQPMKVNLPSPATSVAVVERLVYCVDDRGRVFGWGDNIYGQVERAQNDSVRSPVLIKLDTGVKVDRIVAAGSHTAALYRLEPTEVSK